MKKLNKKIECSTCGSYNTSVGNDLLNGGLMLTTLCIGAFGPCLIFVITWVAIPFLAIGALLGLLLIILGSISKTYVLTCNDCKSKYQLSKEEYKEYKSK